MKDFITNLEAKVLIAGSKALAPLKNRKAVDEGTNSGIRGTTSLIITLVVVAVVVLMGILVATNGQKGLEKTRGFFNQLWSTFDGIN